MHFSDFSREYSYQAQLKRKRKKLRNNIIQIIIALILFCIMIIIIPTKPTPEDSPNLCQASHIRALPDCYNCHCR